MLQPAVGFLTALLLFTVSPAIAAPEVGEPAPGFTAMDTQGTEHSLSDFKGKYVVLEWFNHECPYVRKHYDTKNMQSLQEKYTEKGVVWLAINSSAPGKQGHLTKESGSERIAKEGAEPTALLLDPEGEVGKLYDAKTTPHMYIIDPEGTLVYAGAIDDDSSSRKSAVESATNYVAANLDALMEGNAVKVAKTEPYGCSVKYQS